MHLFYIIRSFLGDINMGFPYFSTKPSFNTKIADNSAGICIHTGLQKSNVFFTKNLVVFWGFFTELQMRFQEMKYSQRMCSHI